MRCIGGIGWKGALLSVLVGPVVLLPGAFGSAVAEEDSPRFLVVHVEGLVTVREVRSSRTGPDLRRVRPMQIVGAGSMLHVPGDSSVELVCPTERLVKIEEEIDGIILEAKLCESGLELPPGTFRSIEPEGGRLRSVGRLLTLERITRGESTCPGAALLDPRNTAVRSPRPRFHLRPTAGVDGFRLSLLGPVQFDYEVSMQDLDCRWDPSWGCEVCSFLYPSGWPELPSGQRVPVEFMTLHDVTSVGLCDSSGSVYIEYLGDRQKDEVGRVLDLLDGAQGLRPSTRRLTRVATLVRSGLLAEAIRELQGSDRPDGPPQERLALADLYYVIGLDGRAETVYRALLERSDEAVRAAAEHGLGNIAYQRADYWSAMLSYGRARSLYLQAGLTRAATKAETALAEAAARVVPR